MRRLGAVAAGLLLVLGACAEEEAARYLRDRDFRRTTLTGSLVNPDNAYSRQRLLRYATGDRDDWDTLPEFNPPSAGLSLDDPDLGRAAFFRYPVQAAAPTIDAGVVEIEHPDGSRGRYLTCSSCHSRVVGDAVVPGLANQQIDFGLGPGLVDVAPEAGNPPLLIPDLRVVGWQSHLHRAGAVKRTSTSALAIRIETLIITSHGGVLRPPRQLAWALARYLESLAPASRDAETRDRPGRAIFDRECASCHAWPSLAGPIYSTATMKTDPAAALSSDRGTGGYRAPSLYGVAQRGRLPHDGSIHGLDEILSPGRPTSGHVFGCDLPPDELQALRAFLELL